MAVLATDEEKLSVLVAHWQEPWYCKTMTNTTNAEATEFDFGSIEGQAVERLRAAKVEPVPGPVVKLAQLSLDGVPHPEDAEKRLHVRTHQFRQGEEAKRDAFVKHMRNAGMHTTPVSSVTVVTDPDRNGNELKVAWRAGKRRGRQA